MFLITHVPCDRSAMGGACVSTIRACGRSDLKIAEIEMRNSGLFDTKKTPRFSERIRA
jgi:hypothetical protein